MVDAAGQDIRRALPFMAFAFLYCEHCVGLFWVLKDCRSSLEILYCTVLCGGVFFWQGFAV